MKALFPNNSHTGTLHLKQLAFTKARAQTSGSPSCIGGIPLQNTIGSRAPPPGP